ncbi:MAG: excinuclease ABC subunit UvrC [Gammaproteobacteria bacterium]
MANRVALGESNFDGQEFAKTLTGKPGVYRMIGPDNAVIYVGKARNLRKRVASYFRSRHQLSPKTWSVVSQLKAIEVTVTPTENEALILENNLIKELKPRYNVVLRDDKSYPYVYLSSEKEFPRLSFHRGARTGQGRYFGPYPNAGAVRASLNLLQKLFLIRDCEDSYFQNRTRPCLQYQIERCAAPCVGFVESTAYREDVQHAVMFLEGGSQEVIDVLIERMEQAALRLNFEQAARCRDQISALQRINQKQYFSSTGGDIDIIASVEQDGLGCVQVFFVRSGHNLGNKSFFPAHTREANATEILSAFLPQYYLAKRSDRIIPPQILISEKTGDLGLLARVLSERAGRAVQIQHASRGKHLRWIEMAQENARVALSQRLAGRVGQHRRMNALRLALSLEHPIERMECFDISHTRGEATVGACVVFDLEGPVKSDYRRFNIAGIEPGDDYAAMHQVLQRRYVRLKREGDKRPDLLLIDGGKGQVRQARDVLDALQIESVCVLGVAKGPSRKAGLETLVLSDGRAGPRLLRDSTALHLIQQIRDEAHRFALSGHRQRRSSKRNTSVLERIEGIGSKRRRSLIQHFGGLQGVERAGVEDLSRAPGISRQLAVKVYERLHHGSP